MPPPHVGSTGRNDDPSPSLVRAELDRILASELFTRTERLSAFLQFIVEQTLAGHGDSLKEQVIATDLYKKGEGFDTAGDPIVRVDARRLRDKLREYYAAATDGDVVISVPKGTYTPVFIYRRDPSAPPAMAIEERGSRRWLRAVVAVTLAAALAAAGLSGVSRMRPRGGGDSMRLLTVTSLPGEVEDPSLSPDGNFVAFSWDGGSGGNHDIYIKAVDSEDMRPLTRTPDTSERRPVWSPDGLYVTFARASNGITTIYRISTLGGHEEPIGSGTEAAWLPDGLSLVVASRDSQRFGLYRIVPATGDRTPLTESPEGFQDTKPRVSPDGKTLAFLRGGRGRAAVYVVPLSGGREKKIGEWPGFIGGLEWTPDGQELLFPRPESSGRRLVRVRPDAPIESAVPVQGVQGEAVNPSVSRPRQPGRPYRLGFNVGKPQIDLRLVDLRAGRLAETIAEGSTFCASKDVESPGRFSADGERVAFTSNRTGSQQVWVANRDGSDLHRVTDLPDATVNVGSWSPNGDFVAFNATTAEGEHIYVVPAARGPIKRLIEGSKSAEADPEWSRDGEWIFYSSNESGNWAIWKVAPEGGARLPVTREPGFQPRESPDGHIYFMDSQQRSIGLAGIRLKRVPIEGGAPEPVSVMVMPGAWDITDAGIVFVAVNDEQPSRRDVLEFYDFAKGRVNPLGESASQVNHYAVNRLLTASRDGRWLLASHFVRWDRNVYVVDNFR